MPPAGFTQAHSRSLINAHNTLINSAAEDDGYRQSYVNGLYSSFNMTQANAAANGACHYLPATQ